jgi:hypothetical protein
MSFVDVCVKVRVHKKPHRVRIVKCGTNFIKTPVLGYTALNVPLKEIYDREI